MTNKNKTLDETLVVLCAKGRNKGLSNKHLRKIKNKKRLIDFALEKVKKNNLKTVCFSTDSLKLSKIARQNKINFILHRKKKLTSSNVPKRDVWIDAINHSEKFDKKKFKYLLDIEITNALLTPEDLKKFINKFQTVYKKFDGMFCVTPSLKNPYFNILKKNKNGYETCIKSITKIYSRQKAPKTYTHVAGFYYFKVNYLKKNRNIFNGKTFGYNIPMIKSFDIDSIQDLNLTSLLI